MSKIEWTDITWNPTRGCTKISPGCKRCYAHTFAERFRGVPGHPYEQGFDLRLVPEKLSDPFTWTKPQTVFVNSMSDLFHEDIPDSYIADVFRVMLTANWHTYQVLTKRSARMKSLMNANPSWCARHIWCGVSVEDRTYGLPRIEHLKQTCAALRFLSCEPLLEDISGCDLTNIAWVIVGGESGHSARPMDRKWVLGLLETCRRWNVPFFFKQWGGVHKAKAGRLLFGRTFDEMPARLAAPFPSREERLCRWRVEDYECFREELVTL